MIAFGFAALIAIAIASFVLTERSRQTTALAQLAQQIDNVSTGILSLSQDAETGQRGFLLTSDPRFLEPYDNAVRRLAEEFARLSRLTRHNPAVSEKVTRLERLVGEKLTVMKLSIDDIRNGVDRSQIPPERLAQGKALMDQIRSVVGAIGADEEQLFAERSAEAHRAGDWLLAGNLAAIALIGALAIGCYLVARAYVAHLLTARNQLESMNADLNAIVEERTGEVMRANEEIQRFAYIVSHDLRSPLVNIMGFTSELEAAGKTLVRQQEVIAEAQPDLIIPEAEEAAKTELPEAIGFIRASTAKMDRLINAILKLSRDGRSTVTPERVDIEKMAQQIADSLKHQTGEIEAEIEVEAAPPIVTDRLAVEQIFGNLIENAVKYLDPGRPGRIVVRGKENGAYAEYQIEDNGRGIDAKDHERVFELFRRSGKQDQSGEGLGLAFVRSSVRKLGGSIRLESELGRGTTMHLKFPKVLIPRQGGRA
jgi:signal transduction histidine kinase